MVKRKQINMKLKGKSEVGRNLIIIVRVVVGAVILMLTLEIPALRYHGVIRRSRAAAAGHPIKLDKLHWAVFSAVTLWLHTESQIVNWIISYVEVC